MSTYRPDWLPEGWWLDAASALERLADELEKGDTR